MTIYVLIDPRDGRVRYVGKTANVAKRFREHRAEARGETHRRARWLQLLAKLGLRPDIEAIEEVDGDGSERERHWIAEYRAEGHDLVNGTDGGEGVTMTPEVRAKIRDAKLGIARSAETCAKIGQSQLGRQQSEAQKLALKAANMGRVQTAAARAKIGAAQRGKAVSEATRAKQREAAQRRHRGAA